MDDEVFDLDDLERQESEQEFVNSTDPIALTTYSQHAARVLQAAATTACTAPGGILTCQDLLLSLATDTDCAAAQVLTECGFDGQRIAQAIDFVQGRAIPGETALSVVHSPRMERVLITAAREATVQKCDEIDTLHLLVALLRERQGITALALESPGVGHERIGSAISQAIRNGMTDPS